MYSQMMIKFVVYYKSTNLIEFKDGETKYLNRIMSFTKLSKATQRLEGAVLPVVLRIHKSLAAHSHS